METGHSPHRTMIRTGRGTARSVESSALHEARSVTSGLEGPSREEGCTVFPRPRGVVRKEPSRERSPRPNPRRSRGRCSRTRACRSKAWHLHAPREVDQLHLLTTVSSASRHARVERESTVRSPASLPSSSSRSTPDPRPSSEERDCATSRTCRAVDRSPAQPSP